MTAPRKPESEKLVRRDAWALPRTWQSIDEESKARNISRQYIIRERLEKAVNSEVKRSGGMIWQPIKTAPKDGAPLLLCVAGCEPLVGRFDARLGWVDFCDGDHSLRELWIKEKTRYEPTHWMPLPPPQKATR